MAPTVCSEKKVRVAGMKEVRRRGSMGMSQAAVATATTTAAGVTQSSSVLSYVAKGSMHSVRRQHRRRVIRLPRVTHISKTSSAARIESRRAKQIERTQLDELDHGDFNETGIQILHTHSSSTNFKTVLQPTTANNNSSKSNKIAAAKLYDQMSSMDDEQQQDSEGDNDSGYDFAMGPIKQHHSQQQTQQCHTHNEGLLSIALKTIKLVQRNKLLQKRLAQLQLETSEFIASVLANPENRHYREKITTKTEAANKVSNVLLRH